MKTFWTFLLTLAVLPAALRAETLQFKNGDKLTGKWLRVEGKKLVFKSDVLGKVEIPLQKIVSFHSGQHAVVMLQNGWMVEGAVESTPSGDWKVQTGQGSQKLPANQVAAIYPQQVFEKHTERTGIRLMHHWSGQGALGYNLAHGDTDASTLSVNFNATRRSPNLPGLREHLRTNVFLNMLFANTRTGQGPLVSSNNVNAGVRQDFLFRPHDFWFLLGQLDHSQAQSLNLRQTYGGGLGRDLVRRPRLGVQLLSGVTFVKENFITNVEQKHSEGLLGEKVQWKIAPWLRVENSLNFYPAVNWAGRYRFDGIASVNTQINSHFSFNTTVTDHYLSRPLPGKQKNDFVLTTGLGLRF